MDIWNSLADVERAAEVTPYLVVAFGALVSLSGIFLKGRVDKRSGAWNATPVLVRAARVTPYAIVLVGALVSASGIHVKGVFDRHIAVLAPEAIQELKNTPPDVRVRLGTATNNGQANPGRTLLEITAKNDIEYNAKWHVSTRGGTLVSGFMTGMVKIVPAATPVFKTAISIQADRVVDDYIELTFIYKSVHSPELGNPPHLRGQISLPYRYSGGRVYLPTPGMVAYWNARRSRQEPASRSKDPL